MVIETHFSSTADFPLAGIQHQPSRTGGLGEEGGTRARDGDGGTFSMGSSHGGFSPLN